MQRDNGKPWSEGETDSLVQLVVEGRAYGDIADILQRTAESCRHKARKMGLVHPKGNRPWADETARAAALFDYVEFRNIYPDVTARQYQDMRGDFKKQTALANLNITDFSRLVYRVEGDAAVVACLHTPQTDAVFWGKVLAIGERDALPNLILAGDAVVADMFSHWPADGVSQTWAWETELESLRLHLRQALNVFEFVTILPGNHVGNRIIRVTNGHIKMAQIINMCGLSDQERSRIQTTDLDYIELGSGTEEFLVAHATNYSKIGGRVPTWYAEKEQKHVIVGNGHTVGMQVTASGKHYGYEIGTAANPHHFGYAMRALTNFPKMNQSFCTVVGGYVKLYGAGKPMTDWESELRGPGKSRIQGA